MLKDLYIDVLIKEPNKNPIKKRIRNEIERITTLLKGRFDLIEYDDESFIAYNYKSKARGKIQVGQHIINGTIIIIGNNAEDGDFKALSDKQIEQFQKEFSVSNTRVLEDEEIEF